MPKYLAVPLLLSVAIIKRCQLSVACSLALEATVATLDQPQQANLRTEDRMTMATACSTVSHMITNKELQAHGRSTQI